MITYRATLDVPMELPGFVTRLPIQQRLLTQRWSLLQHATASLRQLSQIVRAALVLTQFEHKYIRLSR